MEHVAYGRALIVTRLKSQYNVMLTTRVNFAHSSFMVFIVRSQSYLYKILSTCIFCKFRK